MLGSVSVNNENRDSSFTTFVLLERLTFSTLPCSGEGADVSGVVYGREQCATVADHNGVSA